MKPTLTHGLGIAIANMVVGFAMFFLGYHNDVERFSTGQTVGSILGLVIMVTGLYLGMRAVRENDPARGLSYGRGVGSGALISLYAGLFGMVYVFLYGKVINPDFHAVVYDAQVAAMREKGVPEQQIAASENMMRMFIGPVAMAISQLFMTVIIGTILSLIIAIFVKRPPVATTDTPPPLST